jgi:hypothetical protein
MGSRKALRKCPRGNCQANWEEKKGGHQYRPTCLYRSAPAWPDLPPQIRWWRDFRLHIDHRTKIQPLSMFSSSTLIVPGVISMSRSKQPLSSFRTTNTLVLTMTLWCHDDWVWFGKHIVCKPTNWFTNLFADSWTNSLASLGHSVVQKSMGITPHTQCAGCLSCI